MKNIDYFELIYTHRAEMSSGGFHDLLKGDADYQKAKEAEQLARKECETMNLTEKERELVTGGLTKRTMKVVCMPRLHTGWG